MQAQYLYEDQLRIGAALDAAGTMTHRFIYGAKPHVPDYMIRAGTQYKLISDAIGSVRLVVNSATGAVAQQLDYDEFGKVLKDTRPGFQPFGFAGCLYDPDTKLCRFGARDYDAHTGRWVSKDPIGFAGGDTNLYGYVMNDPVNFIDPDGLKVVTGQYVLSPELIALLERVSQYFPGQDVIVTGGNRYRDQNGTIRSATNNQIIQNSARYSKHLSREAVDFTVTGIPDAVAADAAQRVGFDWVKFGYDNPHVHADLGGRGARRLKCQ